MFTQILSHVHPVHLICLETAICFLSLMHYRYDMASNRWQEESHVPKETHLRSIENISMNTRLLRCLKKEKKKKDCSMHWIKYLRNKVLPSTYLNLNAWKLKVALTNCALTIRLLLLKKIEKNNNPSFHYFYINWNSSNWNQIYWLSTLAI